LARASALRWMDTWVDPFLFFLAATSIPMLIVQTGSPSADDRSLITAVSWFIWAAFTVNFGARVLIANDRRAEARALALDLILIVGQPIYTIGEREAGAGLAFLRLFVVAARSFRKGRVLRRSGQKLRSQPFRVVAFIVPFVWLTSAALELRFEAETGTIVTYGDALWWSAVTMATVGYGDISPKSERGRMVAIVTMIVGIGMFSLITAKLAELLLVLRTRGTRRSVVERDHTLILGWSPKVFTIIEQLVIANASRLDPSVVVLAPRDHNDMYDEIRAQVPDLAHANTRLVCRTGSPNDPHDLVMGRPEAARSILVIDETLEDASVVRTLLALLHDDAIDVTDVSIVAEIDHPGTAEAVSTAMHGHAHIVNPTSFIARTTAQACRSAGVARAYEELLDFEGCELYCHQPDLGRPVTYRELHAAYPSACAVGVVAQGAAAVLNPPGDTVVEPGDQVVVLAEDDVAIAFDADAMTTAVPAIPTRSANGGEPAEPEHIVVFGWSPLAPRVLRELDAFVAPGSHVTVAVDPALVDRRSLADDLRHLEASMTNAVITVRDERDAGYAELVEIVADGDADHALVLCYHGDLSPAEADARALVTTLQVQRAMTERDHETTIVTELLDQRDVALAPRRSAGDFIVSDRLISLLLTQIAENPALIDVFGDLLSADGSELYCKDAARYVDVASPTPIPRLPPPPRRGRGRRRAVRHRPQPRQGRAGRARTGRSAHRLRRTLLIPAASRAPASGRRDEREELAVVADVVVVVVLVRREHQQDGVGAVLELAGPDHRRDVDAPVARVEQHLGSSRAVVEVDRHRAGEAHEELRAHVVRVLAPYMERRHVEHDEEPPGREGDVDVDLAGSERPAQIGVVGHHHDAHAGREVGFVDAVDGLAADLLVARGLVLLDAHVVDVADDPRRVADDGGVRRHRPRHDRSRTDHGAVPDGDAREDRGVGADRRAVVDHRGGERLGLLLAARERVVGERRVGSDEDVVADSQAVPELHAALDGDPVAQHHVVLDEDAVADVAVGAEHRAREHVCERPDAGTRPDLVGLADALGMDEDGFGHECLGS
jgi:ion channel POLLUX/CASTOR